MQFQMEQFSKNQITGKGRIFRKILKLRILEPYFCTKIIIMCEKSALIFNCETYIYN